MNSGSRGRPGLLRWAGVAAAVLSVGLLVRRAFGVEQKQRSQTQNGQGDEEPKTKKTRERGRSVAEWVTLTISSAILLAVVATLVYHQLSGGDDPPVIEAIVGLEGLRAAGDTYYLPVEIANQGGATAQDVRVVISIGSDQAGRESAELLIDFLAGGATAKGTVVFHQDPRRVPLEIDVVSYLEP
jgi:uncharacterized protein (TIGR02588 family)